MKENYLGLPIIEEDAWLIPATKPLYERVRRFLNLTAAIEEAYGSLEIFSTVYRYLGFNYDKELKGWYYREWAPAAHSLALIGEFNNWDDKATPLTRLPTGVWEVFLPDSQYKETFKHGTLLKVRVKSQIGIHDRIPAFIRRAVQNPVTKEFSGQLWCPEQEFDWEGDSFDIRELGTPYIYECHIGMATEEQRVGTYSEFERDVLPKIHALGYNCLQIMAIQEHPYYGSFGYHVSNFYAPSSRFGTPEELKSLIKKAHSLGMAVIMDIVHSHAVKNFAEGLNCFDGTDYQYFHGGGRGEHPAWDSKLFNYGKWEVLQFLVSNVRFWLEEYHFDGFRFDGVTSMMYLHHGHTAFDHRDKYFHHVDHDAIAYLQLANTIAHAVKPGCLTIAEDVSGMPGLCRPILEGGIGFDMRLAMGLPDYWIRMMKTADEYWSVTEMWYTMNNRRHTEKHVAYVESHDQAIVGDKTIAFWLMDKEMYTSMNRVPNLIVDRGIALHKMIRFITLVLGGDAYLNFMGNEFGHPEWIDFPRAENEWSYFYARRQWSLAENPFLRYQFLRAFDAHMIAFCKLNRVIGAHQRLLQCDEKSKILAFQKAHLMFVFNFHPTDSQVDYRVQAPMPGKYRVVFDSDSVEFDGFGRIDHKVEHFTDALGQLSLYVPNRTAIVLEKVD